MSSSTETLKKSAKSTAFLRLGSIYPFSHLLSEVLCTSASLAICDIDRLVLLINFFKLHGSNLYMLAIMLSPFHPKLTHKRTTSMPDTRYYNNTIILELVNYLCVVLVSEQGNNNNSNNKVGWINWSF